MADLQLYIQINSLPKEIRREVLDFIEFLKHKSGLSKNKKQRTFGYAKGFFKMKDDFDAPLEDFKEYM